jgi:hypothetical protein
MPAEAAAQACAAGFEACWTLPLASGDLRARITALLA